MQGLTTGLVGAAALWAPHLHQGRAHATLHVGAAEALTHCTGGEAGDASDTDTLELQSSETHWLRRGYLLASPEASSVSSGTFWSSGEKYGLLKSPHRSMSGHPSSAPGGISNMTVSEPSTRSAGPPSWDAVSL